MFVTGEREVTSSPVKEGSPPIAHTLFATNSYQISYKTPKAIVELEGCP